MTTREEQRYEDRLAKLREAVEMETRDRDAALKLFSKATDRWWKVASKHLDSPETPKEIELRTERERLMRAWQRKERTVSNAVDRLLALDNPIAREHFITKQVEQTEQLEELRENAPPRTPTGTPKRELTEDLKARVVDMVLEQGMGITSVAKRLNEDGVLPPGRAKSWVAATVFGVFKKATGQSVSEARAGRAS